MDIVLLFYQKFRIPSYYYSIFQQSTINNNKFVAPNNVTLVERCYRYIKDRECSFSPNTIRNRKNMIKNQIEVFFKDMKLIDITPSILQSYINNIYNEHMLNSTKNQVDFIKSVLKESYRLKEISENICDFVTTPIKKNSSTSKLYTKQKAQLLLEK
ncbi:N-terminal phage integrase SAM-like domain-containing protein, partial [Clostridioides difficile]